ncbi:cell division protein FtsL [Streptococcus ratti]|uniref:Cell division protein FtsL n=2 Tax=Streptococcus ratti TaxID=1341 RepID=A0A7X9LDD9_STRRT|nr:cell division protein FtsL [Streptococcus ratti]VEI59564.1 cell division protein [Streptococcus mutans]EJN95144.1 cell division protein FtsL [Streptococcus ratti FA-1 = DSM 20564]EMP71617.1 cell division protein [Streptococcus ratti FA-1 = DSM 20564]NMD48874.1 cell division protein FtsL [Streptococcus ratti]QEY07138.1 cell division protein FtsL [Streptococcus ratti]
MTNEKRSEALSQALQKRIRTFTRLEKAFYGAIIITAITLAVSIIYLQSRSLQIQQEISHLNSQINDKETEYNNAKQEVNELSRYDRIADIAQKAGMTVQKDNIKKVD